MFSVSQQYTVSLRFRRVVKCISFIMKEMHLQKPMFVGNSVCFMSMFAMFVLFTC